MINIKGKYTEARIFTDNCESEAQKQILDVCNHSIFENVPIRIMPDCHSGAGCVIGFSAPLKDKVIPNIVGVDIGCTVSGYLIDKKKSEIDFEKLDKVIRENIPSGFSGRSEVHPLAEELKVEIERVCTDVLKTDFNSHLLKLGSLGGGNHYIELGDSKEGVYLFIHSGSRNFGNILAKHYMRLATSHENHLIKSLCYLEGSEAQDYLRDMRVAQKYAQLNHKIMKEVILDKMGWVSKKEIISIHNYISDEGMIRKGAVSAEANETLLIPMNMRDGTLLCIGKGNKDYNCTAPHGAGRIMSRSKAKELLNMEDYKESMKGIYTTSVQDSTKDEAPMAYKPMKEIIQAIGETVDLVEIIKPLYNFKSSD